MTGIELAELGANVKSRADLAHFIHELRQDLLADPDGWQNADLASFLEAMAAWVDAMNGYYKNIGESPPEAPSWKTLADILQAARIYE